MRKRLDSGRKEEGEQSQLKKQRGPALSLEERKKIVELLKNNVTQTEIAKKLKRALNTINSFINSEEGQQLIGKKEEELKEERLQKVKQQNARDLVNKMLMGTITPPEIADLKEMLHQETMQGQAERIAQKALIESLGKGYADAIFKKFMDNIELLNKIDSWRAYYESIANGYGYTFLEYAEEGLRYLTDILKEQEVQEKKEKRKITIDDVWNYAITLKMIKSL